MLEAVKPLILGDKFNISMSEKVGNYLISIALDNGSGSRDRTVRGSLIIYDNSLPDYDVTNECFSNSFVSPSLSNITKAYIWCIERTLESTHH